MAWTEPAAWYQQLPTVHVAALALISYGEGRVLLVKQSYRRWWDLPGGMAEAGEPPDVTVAREIQEELGLELRLDRLAVVDWAPPRGDRARPLIAFVFAGGVPGGDPQVVLQRSELDAWRFVPVGEVDGLVLPGTASRIREGLSATAGGATVYLVDGALSKPIVASYGQGG